MNNNLIQIAIVGFGNVGKCVYDALQSAPDMALRCIVEPLGGSVSAQLEEFRVADIKDIRAFGEIDAAVLCLPTRLCPEIAEALLRAGLRTVDSYDNHPTIWPVKARLDVAARESGTAAVISAGWDPGSDSVIRAVMEAMVPRGITYTNFGPGMSMGHSVIARAVDGVENALSMTLPLGAGVHRRMVYVQLSPGASIENVRRAIQGDPDFAKDETHVIQVEDVAALLDMGHAVLVERKGVSAGAHNQKLAFSMGINGPALTAQVLVGAARAVTKQASGCYTLIEIPVIDMLPGERESLIRRLV